MKDNSFLEEVYSDIKKAHYILIVIPHSANCDLICSSLALSNYCFENKIKHKVYFDRNKLPHKLNFLSKFDKISSLLPKYYDLVICIDEPINFPIDNNVKIISLQSQNLTLKNSSSELIYIFFKFNKLNISKNIAECLYVGIYEFSIGFTDNITDGTFDVLSSLVKCSIDVSCISNNLLERDSLSKFKCISKIMNTLELFNEGKIASIYLDNKMIKETGADIHECNAVLNNVLAIGIVDIVVYFKMNDDKIEISLQSKENVDISFLITKMMLKTKEPFSFSINSNNLLEIKNKTINTILDYTSR